MAKTNFISSLGKRSPSIDGRAFVDVSARIIGDVVIEGDASIWPMAVLRADSSSIHIGRGSAVLDLALLEAPSGYPVRIEGGALISHGAIVHGAHICRNVIVGMGAIVLDGVTVSSGSIIAAGAVVTAGITIPENSLVMGTPGRILRETTPGERLSIQAQLSELYEKSRIYMSAGKG